MEYNMDVEAQVYEPDSTVEITDLDAQFPRRTELEIARERYQVFQGWCDETLSNYMAEWRQVRQQLSEVRRQRDAKMEELRAIERNREMASQSVTAANIELANAKQAFTDLQQQLHIEANWRSSVTMSDGEIQALTERVAKLRAIKQRLGLSGT